MLNAFIAGVLRTAWLLLASMTAHGMAGITASMSSREIMISSGRPSAMYHSRRGLGFAREYVVKSSDISRAECVDERLSRS